MKLKVGYHGAGIPITPRTPKPVEVQRRHLGEDNGLHVVLRLLQLLGNCPLKRCGRHYRFKWSTPSTTWSMVVATFFGFIWTIFILHIAMEIQAIPHLHVRYANDLIEKGLKDDPNMDIGKLAQLLISMKISYILVPAFQLLSIFWGWFHTDLLIEFMNNWPTICEEFDLAFPAPQLKDAEFIRYEKCVGRFKLKLALRTIMPILTSVPIFLSGTITGSDAASISSGIFYCAVFLHFSFVEFLEDAKIVLMCHRLSDAFYKIRMSILNSVRWEVLTEARVESWRLVICHVRTQGSLTSSYIKPSQLSFLLNIIATGTVLVYNGLTAPWWTPMGARVSVLDTGFCLTMLWRLYSKADMAEKVTEQEAAIASDLMSLSMSRFSSSVLVQIKLIHDLITQSRTRIRLGSYVTVTKRLFVNIFSQIITYLIVLMQFIPTN